MEEDNFYSKQIMPGQLLPKHKQGHLAVLFVIIAIIIMILAAISWNSFVPTTVRLGGPTDAELEAQSKAAIQKQLNQVMEQPTGSELNAINSQLTNQRTQTASSGEETAIKKQLIVPRASEI